MKGGIALDIQLKRGLLDICVLAAIKNEDSYGYHIIREITPYVSISESTLYPILRRLEEAGKVTSYNTEFHNRIRKYFHITEVGIASLEAFDKDRMELLRVLDYIAGGKAHG